MSELPSWHYRIASGVAGAHPTLPNAAKSGWRVRVARVLRRWANRLDPPRYGKPTKVDPADRAHRYAGQREGISVAGLMETFDL